MKKCIPAFLLSVIFIFLLSNTSWANPEYVMKFGCGSATKEGWNYQWTAHTVFKYEVEKRTKGQVEVRFFPNAQLGGIEQQVIQVRQGLIQACDPEMGHYATLYPNVQVFSIPYLFVDRLVAWEMIRGKTANAMIEDMAKTVGVRPLRFNENGGFRNYSNSKRPLRTAADMKGLKIRTMNIPLHMQIVKDLGASPTPIAWSELYSALQLKVVDGQENAVSTFRIPKLEEVQKYMILDGHIYSITTYLVNEKWFKSLPIEYQNAIYQATDIAVQIRNSLCYLEERRDVEELRAMGVDIYDPPADVKRDFQRMTQKSAIKWLRSQEKIDGKWIDMLLEETAQVEKKLGYVK